MPSLLNIHEHDPSEPLTPADAAELSRLADGFEELTRRARVVQTYGELQELDKFVDSLEVEVT